MTPQPISIREANRLVGMWHRHNRPTQGGLYAIGCSDGKALIGVAIVGRPLSRHLQDGATVEVLRVATTDGAPKGACSWLYARCRRVAHDLGYRRVITYTLATESGASPRGAGFAPAAEVAPHRGWKRPGRPRREQETDQTPKIRWEAET
jgi:hypothetical protein